MSKTELVPMTKPELIAWLSGDDISDEDLSDEITFDDAVRILSATEPETVLSRSEVVKIKDLIGQAFVVTDVSWRKGAKNENGRNRYAFMTCANADGERFLTSCGATKVVLQLRKYEIEGWLPCQMELEAVETSNGRTMLQLVIPSEPF